MKRSFRLQVLERQKGIICVCVELSTAGERARKGGEAMHPNVFCGTEVFFPPRL